MTASPAAELRQACVQLCNPSPTLPLPEGLRIELLLLLSSAADLHEPNLCEKHDDCEPLGCQWCADQDWPCADVRHALAVARQVLAHTTKEPK